jgi:hypothetical protein
MAKRMFSPEIVTSDPFLDMGQGAQLLYFHLAIKADDDGFVSPKGVMRMLGIADDELKVLIAKRFILPFESGVVVIKHWLIHNLIRADLYKETQYKKEKSMLGLNENGAYTEMREGVAELRQIEPPKWLKERRKELRTANVPLSALRIGKDRIGKDRLDKDSIEQNTDGPEVEVKKKIEKETFGEMGKVKLTTEEYDKLVARLGQANTEIMIFELDTYIASKGAKYQSHYATILNWAKRKAMDQYQKKVDNENNKKRIV